MHATDAIFQQMYRHCGAVKEMKSHFSGKNHLYGVKAEVSMLPIGVAINHTHFHSGATAEVAIFRSTKT